MLHTAESIEIIECCFEHDLKKE